MKKLFQLIVVMILFFLPFVEGGCSRASATRAVNESARDIPAAYNVDVLVVGGPNTIESWFMGGEVVDLVGAGDAFRAGFITYIGRNLVGFSDGSIDFAEAVQMGNLFASLYIKAPLDDRYGNIKNYDKMLKVVRSDVAYPSFEALRDALN